MFTWWSDLTDAEGVFFGGGGMIFLHKFFSFVKLKTSFKFDIKFVISYQENLGSSLCAAIHQSRQNIWPVGTTSPSSAKVE